jgi:hypothetical protein
MNSSVHEAEPLATGVQIDDETLTIRLADGRALSVPLSWYPRLNHATPDERSHWELIGDGYAIEWADVDEHIGIEGLLAGRRSGESAESLRHWLASRGK